MDDSVSENRDAAAAALAQMILVFSERTIMPFAERLDKVKLAKVTDSLSSMKSGPGAASTSSLASNGSKPKPAAMSRVIFD